MTPAAAIAALDRQITSHGQAVTFKRGSTVQTARGFVRGYQPQQLIGLLTMSDRQVTVSPTTLGSFAPRKDDAFSTGGVLGVVQFAEAVRMNDTIVRWNIVVRMT